MKGVIFNLLQEAVEQQFGADIWDELIMRSGAGGVYTSLGSYPDEEIFGLVEAASNLTGEPPTAILHWFGEAAMPMLAKRYPEFFVPHATARSFVLSVNEIIHPEVRKLYSGAGCPHFHFDKDDRGRLILGYRSPRQLCHLAHGFIDGATAHFGERAEVEHLMCVHAGAPMCRIAVDWLP